MKNDTLHSSNIKRIVLKYITTIAFVFLILLAIRVGVDMYHFNSMLQSEEKALTHNIKKTFETSKKALVQKYQMLTSTYINSPLIHQFLNIYSRMELYKYLQDDYEDFVSLDTYLFVMHFFDPNNVTIIRMHKPLSYGDDLSEKRPIVAYVNSTLKAQHGFEVGKNGIVYRVTSPLVYQNRHLGALEFGIKLDYFSDELKKIYGTSIAHLVQKDKLTVLSNQKDFPMIGHFSIIEKDSNFDTIKSKIDLSRTKQIIQKNGSHFLVSNLDLEDFEGNKVSKILAIKDITPIIEKSQMMLTSIDIISFLVFIIVVLFLYVIMTKFSKEIISHLHTIDTLETRSSYFKTMSDTDELTQIFNKRYFNRFLKQTIKEKKLGCLLFFDIDHFKNINDTYGHDIGDIILKNLCDLIKTHLRDDDIFVRWGGEEFLIFFRHLELETACNKAEYIRKLVESTHLYKQIVITISIGVTKLHLNESLSTFIKRADTLLYEAKNAGRNCIRCESKT